MESYAPTRRCKNQPDVPAASTLAPQPAPDALDQQPMAVSEWRRPSAATTIGLLLFETVTGLTIYLLPFSSFNQFAVLVHTILGVLMIAPAAWYTYTHWQQRFRGNFNHYQLLGYLSATGLLVTTVSGLVLTWQAALDVRIEPLWDLMHIIAGFSLTAVLAAHLLTVVFRRANNEAARRALRLAQLVCLKRTVAWCAAPLVLCMLLAVAPMPPAMNDSFPASYSFSYGRDRPFAPSLARKDMSLVEDRLVRRLLAIVSPEDGQILHGGLKIDPTKHEGVVSIARRLCGEMSLSDRQRAEVSAALGEAEDAFAASGAIDPRRLAGSEDCGRCHAEIVEEWLPSAHRYASMDFVFQKVQENFAKEQRPEAVRYCAGCHDPIALFSGAKNVGNVTLSVEGDHEGVSCLACHSLVQADVRGNADYTIDPGERYLFEFDEGSMATFVSDFLIRAYPKHHVTSYSRPLYKTAEACGACHKQFVDEEINDFGWVQGQNQYDSWRKSRWHHEGDPDSTISCRECHMPLVSSTDPAAGDRDDRYRHPNDGKHRSHRFLAANQFIPRYHQLPGAEEHCELTVKWLRGEYDIPEIADRWTTGPVVRLAVVSPKEARPGETIKIQTIVTNNKAGHDFPTGPMDMIEGWVEVTVTDTAGDTVFTSSSADDRGYLVNPKIVFKAELIDRMNQLIGKHELWRLVGARFKRTLFPGVSDTTAFEFTCPATQRVRDPQAVLPDETNNFTLPADVSGDKLNVTAIVWYCKFSAPFLDRLFGEDAKQRSEVTEVARAEATIRVIRDDQAAIFSSP